MSNQFINPFLALPPKTSKFDTARMFNLFFTMKNYFSILLFLCVSSGFAQNLKTDTIIIKGKLYYLYPYKFEWNQNYEGESTYQGNDEIPPVLDSLPTGDYVMLHAAKNTWRNRWKKRRGTLKPMIGAEFRVDSGKLNGKVVYFDYQGKKTREGNFHNGLKHGEWLYISKYYDPLTKSQKPYLSSMNWYNNGVEEGLQKTFYVNGDVELEYYKLGDSFEKYYKRYHENGQIELEAYADSATTIGNESPWILSMNTFLYDTAQFEDQRIFTKKEWRKHRRNMRLRHIYSNENIYDYSYDDYRSYSYPEVVPFKIYHYNGELLGKFSAYSENDEDAMQFDTLYNPLGRPALVKIPLPDTVNHSRYRLDIYKPNRTLFSQKYYITDSAGVYRKYRNDYLENGKMQTDFANYSYFFEEDFNKKRKDSLFLFSIESEYGVLDSVFVCPNFNDKKFVHRTDSATGYRKYSRVITFDSAYQYVRVAEFGRVAVHGYYHNDTNETPLLRVTSAHAISGHSYDYSIKDMDSLRLYVDGKPFTGEVKVIRGNGKEAFKIKNEVLTYDRNAHLSLIERYYGGGKIKAKFVNGQMERLESKGYKYHNIYTFKNNKAQGVVKGYEKSKGNSGIKKFRLAFEIPVKDGLYNGTARQWDSRSYRTTSLKGSKAYFLSKEQHFTNGLPTDTAKEFMSNGGMYELKVYNSKGQLHGDNIEYHTDGAYKLFVNYQNGKKEGPLFVTTDLHDTIAKAFFVNGKKEGVYFREYYDRESAMFDHKMTVHFHEGKLLGDITLKDSYNTLRLEIKVDSGVVYDRYAYIDEKELLNKWSEELAFTGEVTVFHPNGKNYANGRMIMKVDSGDGYHYKYMNKTGMWTYYNTVGRKVASLNFKDTVDLVFGTDTVSGVAEYEAFYDNGKTKYIGILNYEDVRLNCATDIQESDFVGTYKTFLSESGDTLVKNGTGSLKLFDAHGKVKEEGNLLNGKRTGWWKEYNEEGVLISVGQYVNDNRDGRWLFGDLTGVNYLDAQCFQSEEVKQAQQEAQKMSIEIEETIYKDGDEMSNQVFEFTRSE